MEMALFSLISVSWEQLAEAPQAAGRRRRQDGGPPSAGQRSLSGSFGESLAQCPLFKSNCERRRRLSYFANKKKILSAQVAVANKSMCPTFLFVKFPFYCCCGALFPFNDARKKHLLILVENLFIVTSSKT